MPAIPRDQRYESDMSLVSEEYNPQSRALGPMVMDNASLGDGRTPKKFQKGTSDGNIALRRPALDSTNPDLRSNFGSRRRQSIRDQNAPQPTPILQRSPSKRITYYNNQRSAASSSKDAHSRQSSINRPSGHQFGLANSARDEEKRNSLGSFEFLPSVNFDDFHASLTMDEANPSLLPTPNGIRDTVTDGFDFKDEQDSRNGTKIPLKITGPADSGSNISRSGSFLRRTDSQTKPIAPRVGHESMVQSIEMSGSRPRRKSQFPVPDSNTSILRNPRKSVGPGILAQDVAGSIGRKVEPSLSIGDDLITSSRKPSKMFPTARIPGEALPTLSATRQSKTKSLHIPSGPNHDPFTSSFGTPENTLSSIGSARSPGRPIGQQTGTPLSGKRMSIMPNSAHATGLAARTISPTDARRLRRMSVMPNPPPMPHTPTASQPEPPLIPQFLVDQTVPSPSLIPQRNSTPTSTRTTPEPNRKSYSSGISNSSTTSYNSCQSSNGPVRISQSFSTSRLPTLKTRNDPAPAGIEEMVPPVPAIPKAYESPKTELDQPFFSIRKGSLPYDVSSLASASTADGAPFPSTDADVPTILRKLSLKKPTSNDNSSGNDRKSNVLNNSRKTLQPLRLPPLNLLPLSTPTAAKIDALYDGAVSKDQGTKTPPPKVGPKGIPSTPMTASRASFFARSQPNGDPMPISTQLRSSSSYYALRSESSSHNGADSSTSTITAGQERGSRRVISPYISSSLPKTSGDFGYLRHTTGNTTDTGLRVDSRSTKLMGPRMQTNHRTPKDDSSSIDNSPVETSTSSFSSSLRRKLSLTRKRSGSKTQSRAGSEDEIPPRPPKHDNMPPPRLPASATWNGPLMPSPSPTQKHNFLPTKRKPSNPISQPIDRNRSQTWTTDGSPQKIPISSDTAASKRTLRSTLEGSHTSSAMSLKDFLKETNVIEMQMDRDDRQAEEEMKKLASKRKDTENATKELDALRRRATPKEPVSASVAARMAQLNIFERGEIVDYKDVFFCGTENTKKHVGDLNTETANFGYDDERGDYNIVTGDHLAYRYEIVDILGKGSFGQVTRCIDHKTGGLVAIKIIRNKKRFHQQALVEVDILQKLRDWDPQKKHSMVEFTQSFYFRGHLCISTELLGMNLYEFIKCHDFRGFSLKLIRRFAKQLLSSLVLLKAHRVIHCDLKPENILLAHPTRSEIKVIDFGSSCMENEKVYTYIQSRFYRSPEVILGMTYGMPIDIWSLGCILAELLTGYPIFPGENEQEQLACIMEVFGPPEKHLIEKSTRKKLFFDSLGKPRLTVSSKGKRRRPSSKSLQQALKCEDEAFLDFISRCLRWDPDRRIKADEATRHEFITGVKPAVKPFNSRTAASQGGARIQAQAPSSVTNSPVKRLTSIQTPSAAIRPLPEPPATVVKIGPANSRSRDISNVSSPSKPSTTTTAAPKRHSTVSGLQSSNTAGLGTKRNMNGTAVAGPGGSALPRLPQQQRSASGKPDLAVAGAVASLQRSR